jgi:hypothetical protein
MNTIGATSEKNVARVAIDVRLYFDVPIISEDPDSIRCAAREELKRVAYEELIRLKMLRFPNIYPTDKWPAIELEDFQICQICPASEANKDTRFAL